MRGRLLHLSSEEVVSSFCFSADPFSCVSLFVALCLSAVEITLGSKKIKTEKKPSILGMTWKIQKINKCSFAFDKNRRASKLKKFEFLHNKPVHICIYLSREIFSWKPVKAYYKICTNVMRLYITFRPIVELLAQTSPHQLRLSFSSLNDR